MTAEQFFAADELEALYEWLEEDESNLGLLSKWIEGVMRVLEILAPIFECGKEPNYA